MANEKLINKLYKELEDLNLKILYLDVFLKTNKFEDFKKHHALQGSLIETQRNQMGFYKDTLIWRIALLKNKDGK